MFMNAKTLVKQAIVALNFPTAISPFIVFAKAICQAMLNNPLFKASAEKVTKLSTDITALLDVETGCATNPPTATIESRNVAHELVKADLRALRIEVQVMADGDPENAAAIITAAGMSIKKLNPHGKQQNSAHDGAEEGSVDLTGEGAGPHEWRMSEDGTNWRLIPASRTSKTKVSGLTSGWAYFFQNRQLLTNDLKSEWSQSVKIRVR